MFKKTLVAAALATATMGATAAVQLAGDAFQVYGQAAGYALHTADDVDDNTSVGFIMESRIGFRGVVEFENFAPNFVWKIEGGNADNTAKSGQLGARDTYVGLDFDGVGTFKIGRQLVAAYNLVDWPHSNPGLGNVFDWNNDIGAAYQDRADGVLRYDSATWGGVNISATLSNMNPVDQMVYSAAISYTPIEMLNLHAGYYGQGDYDTTNGEPEKYEINSVGNVVITEAWADWSAAGGAANPKTNNDGANYAIVGGAVYIDALTLTAAYKAMDKGDNSQDAVSATAQYVIAEQYVLKAGYASTFESKLGTDDGDTAITARLGYLLPSSYFYFDVRNYTMDSGSVKEAKFTNFLLGAEYYF